MEAKRYIYIQNKYIMEVVTAREFRTKQGSFLTAARNGQTVLLTSRYGNFKIVPVSSDDQMVGRDVPEACAEVKAHVEGKIELPRAEDIVF